MIGEEKLRTLLVEARAEIVWLTTYYESRTGTEFTDQIDAALAEPVVLSESKDALHARAVEVLQREWDVARSVLKRERDEARAEVARLKGELKMECGFTDSYIKALHKAGERAKDAYQRGAEAMREASLRVCNEASFGWGADDIAEELRALPTPEDTHGK